MYFYISDFEMTPTLEKNVDFMGKGSSVPGVDLCNKTPIIPKHFDIKKFLELLKINLIEKVSFKMGKSHLNFYTRDMEKGWIQKLSKPAE